VGSQCTESAKRAARPDLMSEENARSGDIITFYSYKGGTGRTLALANVACLLARAHPRDKILMVDWDLEAPGLHRYFRDQIEVSLLGNLSRERAMDEKEGLLDFFVELNRRSEKMAPAGGDSAAVAVKQIYKELAFERFILKTDVEGLELMKAGRFDAEYPNRVNSFDWAKLFSRSEWFIRLFADELKQRYRYILIDSRTGITDTSGICTTLLPDKLVVVFTPNRQSLTGIRDLVKSATDYRRRSPDVRPLVVFPLASRVEVSKPSLQKIWRTSPIGSAVTGYQPMFEELFRSVYGLKNGDLQKYFDEIQIQQVADYAYGEEIAVLTDFSKDRFSLATSFQAVSNRLESAAPPWEEPDQQVSKHRVSAAEAFRRRIARPSMAFIKRHPILSLVSLAVVGLWFATVWMLEMRSFETVQARDHAMMALEEAHRAKEEASRLVASFRGAETNVVALQTQLEILTNDITKALTESAESREMLKLADAKRELAESKQVSLTAQAQYLSNDLARATFELSQLLSVSNALQARLGDNLQAQTNLVARLHETETALYTAQSQIRDLQGWKTVISGGLVKLSAATGKAPPLAIGTNVYLWATAIEPKEVQLVVRSAPPSSGGSSPRSPGVIYFSARLIFGGYTNFFVGPFEYKVTVDDIFYSDLSDAAEGKADMVQNAGRSAFGRASAAVFSVDRRPPQLIKVRG